MRTLHVNVHGLHSAVEADRDVIVKWLRDVGCSVSQVSGFHIFDSVAPNAVVVFRTDRADADVLQCVPPAPMAAIRRVGSVLLDDDAVADEFDRSRSRCGVGPWRGAE